MSRVPLPFFAPLRGARKLLGPEVRSLCRLFFGRVLRRRRHPVKGINGVKTTLSWGTWSRFKFRFEEAPGRFLSETVDLEVDRSSTSPDLKWWSRSRRSEFVLFVGVVVYTWESVRLE